MSIFRKPKFLLLTFIVLGLGLTVSASPQQGPTVTASPASFPLAFQLRDGDTAIGLQGVTVRGQMVSNAAPDNLQPLGITNIAGDLTVQLAPGQYAFEIVKDGYKPWRAVLSVGSGEPTLGSIDLAPVERTPEFVKAEASIHPGFTISYGYTLDAATHQPLGGVEISFKENSAGTISDSSGFYFMSFAVPLPFPEETPNYVTLIATKAGYSDHVVENVELDSNGGEGVNVELTRGRGKTVQVLPVFEPGGTGDAEPPDSDGPGAFVPMAKPLHDWMDGIPSTNPHADQSRPLTLSVTGVSSSTSPQVIPLPTGIRVGSNCPTKKTCATITYYPLEDYVALGLSGEWQPSYSGDALKAGAVAYRGYGAYYANNPLTAAYDICSDTRCQMFKNVPNLPSINSAVKETAGVVMTRNGIPIKSEYAAETNGLAQPKIVCKDGETGDGTSDWPCMPDVLSAGAQALIIKRTGRPERNHGRGMSTRGSERWATGKNHLGQKVTETTPWQCILDHYYGDNGNQNGDELGKRTSTITGGSGDGLIAYTQSNAISNLDGSGIKAVETGGWAAWSPNQKRLLVNTNSSLDGPNAWALVDLDGGNPFPLSFGRITPNVPLSWAPIGTTHRQRIVFTGQDQMGYSDIYTMNPEGGGIVKVTNSDGLAADLQPSFSSDGKRIAALEIVFTEPITDQIVVMDSSGSGKIALTPKDGSTDCENPSWSPDGHSVLAFCTHYRTGDANTVISAGIYRLDASGFGMQLLTSVKANKKIASYPQYTQDGKHIIFNVDEETGGEEVVEMMDADGSGRHAITASAPYQTLYGVVQVTRCRRFDVD